MIGPPNNKIPGPVTNVTTTKKASNSTKGNVGPAQSLANQAGKNYQAQQIRADLQRRDRTKQFGMPYQKDPPNGPWFVHVNGKERSLIPEQTKKK